MTKHLWQKGQSGNPNGAPKKNRALTAILEAGGSKSVEYDGKPIAGKRLIALLLWQLVTAGECTLPSGKKLEVGPLDWLDVVKWLYQHIDGPAKQTMELSGNAEAPLTIRYIDDWRNRFALPASRTTDGENASSPPELA